MSFKPLSISQGTKYKSTRTNFLGVDYSTQKFSISPNRAIDLCNYFYKDNVIQVREGVEELFEVTPFRYIPLKYDNNAEQQIKFETNTTNFNGLWSFKDEEGHDHLIAHIGKLLYEIKNNEAKPIVTSDYKTEPSTNKKYYFAYAFEDYKSSAFVGSNRLYFLGGNKYMCLRFENNIPFLYPVENNAKTYIPTTTISITYANSLIPNRSSLDKVNLLNQWRINELMSGTLKNKEDKNVAPYFDYTLDAPIIFKDNEKDYSDIEITLIERGEIE